MEQTIKLDGLALPVSSKLAELLRQQLCASTQDLSYCQAITLNFRDPDYSANKGGYHPVEIRLVRNNQAWTLNYITTFSFVGIGWNAELAKELDFDFGQNIFEMRGYRPQPLAIGEEMYRLFESNFLVYAGMEVFNVVTTLEED